MAKNPLFNRTTKEWKECYEAFGYKAVGDNNGDQIWRLGTCGQVTYSHMKDSEVVIDRTGMNNLRHMEKCGIKRADVRKWFENKRNGK